MPDLSNAEISVEGEYGYCLMCGESFHWEQLTNTEAGSYCEAHDPFAGIVDVPTNDGWNDQSSDLDEVRDYSDAITRLIGGLAEVWRMPDA